MLLLCITCEEFKHILKTIPDQTQWMIILNPGKNGDHISLDKPLHSGKIFFNAVNVVCFIYE